MHCSLLIVVSLYRAKSKKMAEQAAAEVAIMCLDIPR